MEEVMEENEVTGDVESGGVVPVGARHASPAAVAGEEPSADLVGTPIPVQVNESAAEVEELRGELTALRNQHEGELTALRNQLIETQQGWLDAHRRALLAEHAGQVVGELVTGATVEELNASVDAARTAYGRALEAARQELGAMAVPVGASPRAEL